jgi:hypothetical protein
MASVHCGFGGSQGPSAGTAGSSATGGMNPGTGGSNTQGSAGSGQGTSGTNGQGTSGTNGQGMSGTNGQGMSGTNGQGTGGMGGMGGMGGTGPVAGSGGTGGVINKSGWKNYEVTASFPNAPVAVTQAKGTLQYTKVVIHSQFLAESCSIGDYNGDGIPDVSSGRIWYEGTNDPTTTFKTQHPFRDGHGALPRNGDGIELNTGVSDDWADYPWDMDGDGDTDIINVAQCDVPEANPPTGPTGGPANNPPAAGTPNKIGTVQVHATAVWYENPGKAGNVETITTNWTAHLMNSDVRMEQHELVDYNGDGYPEILGGCRDCGMGDTKGYYQGDPTKPTAQWTYHQVTAHFTFPFGNLGWMHGVGGGDINGDGKPDWMDRSGAYLQQPDGSFNQKVCTAKDTPAGCGLVQGSPLLPQNFSKLGMTDNVGNIGPSHMFAVDMDMDGCTDVVAAEWAHGSQGIFWYGQVKDGTGCTLKFNKYQFLGDNTAVAKWGAGFTEPHAFNVYDMDGDGRPDVIAGKMRFAHPINQNDPDPHGTPYLYVFKNMAQTDPNNMGPITLKPFLVDGNPGAMEGSTDAGMGVGRQFAVGHVNTDGIVDICVGTKLGLAVFLGK